MKQNKRIAALLLAALMVLSTLSAIVMGVMSVTAAEDNIQSDDPVKIDACVMHTAVGRGPQIVGEGSVYGLRMN